MGSSCGSLHLQLVLTPTLPLAGTACSNNNHPCADAENKLGAADNRPPELEPDRRHRGQHRGSGRPCGKQQSRPQPHCQQVRSCLSLDVHACNRSGVLDIRPGKHLLRCLVLLPSLQNVVFLHHLSFAHFLFRLHSMDIVRSVTCGCSSLLRMARGSKLALITRLWHAAAGATLTGSRPFLPLALLFE